MITMFLPKTTITIDHKTENMKRFIYILFLLPLTIWGQDNNQNFVKSINYRQSGAASPKATVQYFDGFGRLVQKINNKQSGTGKDLVTYFAYDQGRQTKEYLTYSTNQESMSFYANAEQSILNYPHYAGKYPVSEKLYENSPLDRVLKQGAPGEDWQVNPTANTDHTIKFEYRTNGQNEVKSYFAATTWNASSGLYDIQLVDRGYYSAGELGKTITKDENWTSGTNNTSEDYKDREGRIVLKRAYNNGAHDTYFIYDKFGNLTYVLPPLVTNPTSQLNDLCYQYKYDKRKRLVEKKLPGKQWEFMVYDKADKLVASGPANSPFSNLTGSGWIINKYDAFGRIAYTGWYSGTEATASGRKSMQGTFNFSGDFYEARSNPNVLNGVTVGYTNLTFPTSGMHLLSVNYYDNYTYPSAIAVPATIEGQSVLATPKALATASWSRILTASGEVLGDVSTMFYDSKGREIRTHKTNEFGGYTQIDTKLDFMGKRQYAKTFHKRNNSATLITITDQYTYTPEDRLLLHTQQINNQPIQLIAKNSYNEIGELISKNVGGNDATGAVGLQKIDYRYNIRGWLTDVNNDQPEGTAGFTLGQGDLFGFKINYNKVTESQNSTVVFSGQSMGGSVKPMYNGNVAETFWLSANDNQLRKYGYQYDALNRMQSAFYQKPISVNPTPGSYNEQVSYDKNGNILTLRRKGNLDNPVFNFDIDNLNYTHNGNKLTKVTDSSNNPEGFADRNIAGDTYQYDVNGSLTADVSKGIVDVKYNHMNLPREINFSGGAKINYIYNAEGTTLRKTVNNNTTTLVVDYLQGFQYEDGVLSFFPQAEGYVKVTGQTFFNYVFNYVDQLGNIRATWAFDDREGNVKILEENHYYPFGLKHKAYNTVEYAFIEPSEGVGYYYPILEQTGTRDNRNPYKYKFQGQEYQDDLGLNVYFFKFRASDPAIGRFWQIDPLAPTYVQNSTYVFAENNVTTGIDLEGLELSFHLEGDRARAQSGPYRTGGVNGNYTLQELKSVVAKKQAEHDRGMAFLLSGDPRKLPQAEIRLPSSHIDVAKYNDAGMMLSYGVLLGATEMTVDAVGGFALNKLGVLRKSVWTLDKFERGRVIERMLGAAADWPSNFPVIDKIVKGAKGGIATSIKSLDLTASSYKDGDRVFKTLKGYIDKLDNFGSRTWGKTVVERGVDYTSKALEVAVQTGKGSKEQWKQIEQAVQYALDKDIELTIKFIR